VSNRNNAGPYSIVRAPWRRSAFGAKRTCRELGRQIDRSQMTQSGHRPA
jgi:hypothetical protein